jgi:hypothetical protein
MDADWWAQVELEAKIRASPNVDLLRLGLRLFFATADTNTDGRIDPAEFFTKAEAFVDAKNPIRQTGRRALRGLGAPQRRELVWYFESWRTHQGHGTADSKVNLIELTAWLQSDQGVHVAGESELRRVDNAQHKHTVSPEEQQLLDADGHRNTIRVAKEWMLDIATAKLLPEGSLGLQLCKDRIRRVGGRATAYARTSSTCQTLGRIVRHSRVELTKHERELAYLQEQLQQLAQNAPTALNWLDFSEGFQAMLQVRCYA